MKAGNLAAVACAAVALNSAWAVVPFEFITVGDPGNPPDANGYGAVDYVYRISKDAVTNEDYAIFLNAADPRGENPRGIYDMKMASAADGGILFDPQGAEGAKYRPRPGRETSPVTYVSWFDAARYANWLSNGSRLGSSTEVGAYNLRNSPHRVVPRSRGAKYWIPTENEWYKAAFYRPGAEEGRVYVTNSALQRIAQGDIELAAVTGELVDAAPSGSDATPLFEPASGPTPVKLRFLNSNNPETQSGGATFRIAASNGNGPNEERREGANWRDFFAIGSEGGATAAAPFFGAFGGGGNPPPTQVDDPPAS